MMIFLGLLGVIFMLLIGFNDIIEKLNDIRMSIDNFRIKGDKKIGRCEICKYVYGIGWNIECRKHAPVALKLSYGDAEASFPSVDPYVSCGDFEEKEKVDDGNS